MFFSDILGDGDVHNWTSGRARREEERRKLDKVGTFSQENLRETVKKWESIEGIEGSCHTAMPASAMPVHSIRFATQ
jgi:hypothetical protein